MEVGSLGSRGMLYAGESVKSHSNCMQCIVADFGDHVEVEKSDPSLEEGMG